MTVVGVYFLIADLVQFLVVFPLVKLRPAARSRIVAGWIRFLRRVFYGVFLGLSGARIRVNARVPFEPGWLIVMNHQSLLDIPVATSCVPEGYCRIITRIRYARGIPLISSLIRLCRHPVVTPGANLRQQLIDLREVAETAQVPVTIFPEGHRTSDGEIRHFKTAGLKTMLSVRKWNVALVVVDGAWKWPRFVDFLRNISHIRVVAESGGISTFDPEHDDVDEFIDALHTRMCDKLAEMRNQPEAAAKS